MTESRHFASLAQSKKQVTTSLNNGYRTFSSKRLNAVDFWKKKQDFGIKENILYKTTNH